MPQKSPVSAAATVDCVSAPAQPGMLYSLRASWGFRMHFASTISTNTGYWMYQIALGWLALQQTNSPAFVGITGFASGIPLLLLSIPAGVVIDRIDRRMVLMAGQIGAMVVSTLFFLLVLTGHLPTVTIPFLAFFNGTAMSFIFPTRNAILPDLVERRYLANTVALNAAGQNATRVIGPSLAGVLIAAIGISGTFAVAAGLQIVAAYWSYKLPHTPMPTTRGTSLRSSVMTGVRAVLDDSFLVGIILLSTSITVLIMPYIILMPVFARDLMHLSSLGLGILMASIGLGSVAGALSVAKFGNLTTTRGFQIVAAISFALSVIAFAAYPHLYVALPLLFTAGWTSAAFMAINQTILQLNVADEVRGRVLAIYMLTWGMQPVGQLLLGTLAGRIGTSEATIISASVAILCMLLLTKRYKQLRG